MSSSHIRGKRQRASARGSSLQERERRGCPAVPNYFVTLWIDWKSWDFCRQELLYSAEIAGNFCRKFSKWRVRRRNVGTGCGVRGSEGFHSYHMRRICYAPPKQSVFGQGGVHAAARSWQQRASWHQSSLWRKARHTRHRIQDAPRRARPGAGFVPATCRPSRSAGEAPVWPHAPWRARPGVGARRPKTLLHASIPDWVPQRDSRGELPSVAEIMRRHAESDHADARPWRSDVIAEEPYYQVAVRPLALGREYENSKYIKPLSYQKKIPMRDFHFEHVQFIGNDGSNFGLSKGQNTLMIEEESALGRYVAEPVKLRKEYIDRARDELERRWQEKALAVFRENPSRKLA